MPSLCALCSSLRVAFDADLRAEPADHPGAAGLPVRPHARVPRRDRPLGSLRGVAVHHAQRLERQRRALGLGAGWCGPGSLFPQRFSGAPVLGGVGGLCL